MNTKVFIQRKIHHFLGSFKIKLVYIILLFKDLKWFLSSLKIKSSLPCTYMTTLFSIWLTSYKQTNKSKPKPKPAKQKTAITLIVTSEWTILFGYSSGIFHCFIEVIIQMSEWKSLSRAQLFATPWTVACQPPLSMEFSK